MSLFLLLSVSIYMIHRSIHILEAEGPNQMTGYCLLYRIQLWYSHGLHLLSTCNACFDWRLLPWSIFIGCYWSLNHNSASKEVVEFWLEIRICNEPFHCWVEFYGWILDFHCIWLDMSRSDFLENSGNTNFYRHTSVS